MLQDIETYKSSTRESLQSWLAQLRQHNVVDWLVVVVESAEARSKANKLLPRSSVLDKVKADINSKHGDRSVGRQICGYFPPVDYTAATFNDRRLGREWKQL